MIEPTDKMGAALLRALPPDARWGWKPEDAKAWLAAVLAIVEREYVILPRGAQAICCRDHPDRPVRWGQCGECLAEMPPEERT